MKPKPGGQQEVIKTRAQINEKETKIDLVELTNKKLYF